MNTDFHHRKHFLQPPINSTLQQKTNLELASQLIL